MNLFNLNLLTINFEIIIYISIYIFEIINYLIKMNINISKY